MPLWPEDFTNHRTGAVYKWLGKSQEEFITDKAPRYKLLVGGEGAGTTSAGIIKTLNHLRNGHHGIMVAPTFGQLRVLWPQFQSWCPKGVLAERQAHRLNSDWSPMSAFELSFKTDGSYYSNLLVGSVEDPDFWHGPNSHFVFMDAVDRIPHIGALKVLDGGCRLTGNGGVQPELFLAGLPRATATVNDSITEHWMYHFFMHGNRMTKVYRIGEEGWVSDRSPNPDEGEYKNLMEGEWA